MTDPKPQKSGSHWYWRHEVDACSLIFVGRGDQKDVEEVLHSVVPDASSDIASVTQIHSGTVINVKEGGPQGKGDALITSNSGLILSVATADCVPVVIACSDELAVVHAGWRGVVAQIVPKTIQQMTSQPGDLSAWIGPAIGACCYEVGPEVASKVAAACQDKVVTQPANRKPHLDLARAVRSQLVSFGVGTVHTSTVCTRCNADWLWSYRRDGDIAGRNYTFAWLKGKG